MIKSTRLSGSHTSIIVEKPVNMDKCISITILASPSSSPPLLFPCHQVCTPSSYIHTCTLFPGIHNPAICMLFPYHRAIYTIPLHVHVYYQAHSCNHYTLGWLLEFMKSLPAEGRVMDVSGMRIFCWLSCCKISWGI